MWLTQKDLGTWILNDLKWDYNLNYQKRQTLKKVFVILNTFMTRDVVPMTTFWKSICMSTLMYNTSVMGKLNAYENKILEHVQFDIRSLWTLEASNYNTFSVYNKQKFLVSKEKDKGSYW